MKELKSSITYVIIFQVLSWGLFTLIDEFEEGLISIGLIGFPLLLIIVYFILSNEIINKNQFKSLKFNVLLFVFGILLTIKLSPAFSLGCKFTSHNLLE